MSPYPLPYQPREQRPAVLWTVRRHTKYARDMANREVSPGSGGTGIAPFDLTAKGNRLLWNTPLRSYVIDMTNGRTLGFAGCGNVGVSSLAGGNLLIEACGEVRRATLGGSKLSTQWEASFDSIGEIAGDYAIAYAEDGEDAAVLDLRSGEIQHRFDSSDAEAITLDTSGRLALAEGIYAKGAEEWDIPKRIRTRVLDRDGNEDWVRSLDIEPNGLGLELEDDTLTVSNWDLDGREHLIEVTEDGLLDRKRIRAAGDTLDERDGYKLALSYSTGRLRLTSPAGESKFLGRADSTEWSAARITAKTVLVVGDDALRAYRLVDGHPLWTLPLPTLSDDATAERSIVVTDHGLFIAGPSRLVAIGATGNMREK